ncbi:unnamed protein product, partial [marine sediment metagenome]
EIEIAMNGIEAVEQYKKAKDSGQSFDAVILDLTIPGDRGGKEAIKRLLEIDPEVKAIVSSGYSNNPIMSDYEKYGFNGIIAKPYEIEELSKTLHGLIMGMEEQHHKVKGIHINMKNSSHPNQTFSKKYCQKKAEVAEK